MATPAHRFTGRGIVPVATTWSQVTAFAPDVYYFDCTDRGLQADMLRKAGSTVFGASAFFDKLEKDRDYGMRIAEKIGMTLPEYYTFGSITESLKWLQDRPSDEKWYFKTDRELGAAFTAGGDKAHLSARLKYVRASKGDRIKHLLQKAIDGADLSTAFYWNGRTFLLPAEGTLERKEFGESDTGPKTGCAMNLMWFYSDVPKVVHEQGWAKLIEIFRAEQAPPGIVDINAILGDDGKVYFLEWTPRLGIDAEPTAQRLLQIEYGEFISRLCDATLPVAPFSTDNCAYSIRLSVPPYPYEPNKVDEKNSPIGLPCIEIQPGKSLWGRNVRDRLVAYGLQNVDGEIQCADPFGLLGIASAIGTNLDTMNDACVKYAKDLRIPDLGYRTDGAKMIRKDLAAVRATGHEAPTL